MTGGRWGGECGEALMSHLLEVMKEGGGVKAHEGVKLTEF